MIAVIFIYIERESKQEKYCNYDYDLHLYHQNAIKKNEVPFHAKFTSASCHHRLRCLLKANVALQHQYTPNTDEEIDVPTIIPLKPSQKQTVKRVRIEAHSKLAIGRKNTTCPKCCCFLLDAK
jgi:hypothetical protein